ncbi:unnamed protein product, partial [Dracunculus medinensis]|uniref:ANF_receptor domain-containing protein n=1 Tax=Dracunculus medinensis TaxID=318479 RepID=A0A0N4UR96_DRAME
MCIAKKWLTLFYAIFLSTANRLVVFLNENNRSMFNAIAAYHGFANITIFERDDKPGSVPKTVCQRLTDENIIVYGPETYPANLLTANYAGLYSVPHFYLQPIDPLNIPKSKLSSRKILLSTNAVQKRRIGDMAADVQNSMRIDIPCSEDSLREKEISLKNITAADSALLRTIDLFPTPRIISNVLISIVNHYKWTSLVLLYRNASDLTDLQHFVAESHFPRSIQIIMRSLPTKNRYRRLLKEIRDLDEMHIILHADTNAIIPFLYQAYQQSMCTSPYHYVITNYDAMTLDLSVHPIDACNVTVVSFIDIRSKEVAALRTHLQKFNITIPQNSINVEAAVWSDSLALLKSVLSRADRMNLAAEEYSFCDRPHPYGERIISSLVKARVKNSITGPIALNIH